MIRYARSTCEAPAQNLETKNQLAESKRRIVSTADVGHQITFTVLANGKHMFTVFVFPSRSYLNEKKKVSLM
jgi:hypothetical protein